MKSPFILVDHLGEELQLVHGSPALLRSRAEEALRFQQQSRVAVKLQAYASTDAIRFDLTRQVAVAHGY